MLSLLNFFIALIDIVLLFYVIRALPSEQGQWRKVFLVVLLCGMTYDNLMVASGYWLIEQPWFTTASMGRFYIHVLSLPFLSLFTFSIIRDSGLSLGKNKAFFLLCTLVTAGALAFGISQELMGLQLVENSQFGIRRMSNAHGSAPVATILTNLFTLVLAAYLWRKSGFKLLFLGSLFIFVVNGATAGQAWGFIAGNLAEIVFVLSLIVSHKHLSVRPTMQQETA